MSNDEELERMADYTALVEENHRLRKMLDDHDAEIKRLQSISNIAAEYGIVGFVAVEEMQSQLSEKSELLETTQESLWEHMKLLLLAKEAIEKAIVMAGHPDNIDYLQSSIAAIDNSKLVEGLILCDARPDAFMRDEGKPGLSTMCYCIPTSVKEIWLKANPIQVERYTIPLYAPRSVEK